mmetsp:Transcript_23470/g.33132  ORF Transcript_23470/g.33132 Transcript_23470/m.33132 type:complete len:129 (-) Transcript_23470:214-600(-)|eukprot:CAMPEP_0175097018 /NCGR_PEP_ID=MMETSP0086_2-20121207/5055_1 /TAXON_ID=136419 /ORGANISM="Unknown Unknown, Strain D1" /LENGTH=128 /DNA_ID=CAMNT_0016370485 /DNA_START=28 /DNA_END=414 /DNA_ORIENTATION=-
MNSLVRSLTSKSAAYLAARTATRSVPTLFHRSFGGSIWGDDTPLQSYLPREVILPRVMEVLCMFDKIDASKVTPTARFADLGLDSLDSVEVVMAIEEEFVLNMSDEDADRIASVEDAVNYLVTHPNAK